jgi:hypothetical protein
MPVFCYRLLRFNHLHTAKVIEARIPLQIAPINRQQNSPSAGRKKEIARGNFVRRRIFFFRRQIIFPPA